MLKIAVLAALLAAVGSADAAPPSLFETVGAADSGKAKGVHPVTLNPDALKAAIAEKGMWIPLPDRQRMFARTVHYQYLRDGNVSWTGKVSVQGVERTVLVTAGPDAAFGSLVAADGSALRLETRAGATYLVAPDSRFDALHRAPGNETPDYVPAEPLLVSKSDIDRTQRALALASSPVVDVFVGYTPGLIARYGSEAAALTRLNFLVATTNQAFADSRIDATLRLVGTQQVAYSETETNSLTLRALSDRSGASPLQTLRDARRRTGADMLVIVRPYLKPEHGNCGVATINGFNLSAYTVASATGANASVSDGPDDNSGWFCSDTTFAHELGHNWGLVHDSANASNPGPFAYTYGWRQTLPQNGFYTLMAYGADGQSLAPYYSNPDIYLCGGQPCGDAGTANQARALRQVLPVAAAFNQPMAPLIDLNGDGSADVVYQNNGSLTYVLYNGGNPLGAGQQSIGAGYRIVAAGDFNGDHRTDIAWMNATFNLVLWLTQADGSFQQQPSTNHAGDWAVVGAGDMSGDGKADLLWINKTTHQFRYWVMDGNSATSVQEFTIHPGYYIVAARDFNADGRTDLMWTNSERKLEYWQNKGDNTFDIVASPLQYDSNLGIAGAGDFDNDQKADLAFFNYGSLLLSPTTVWLMDGANRIGTQSVAGPILSLLHEPVAVDRYSGGTASVMWSSGIRDLYLSENNGTGESYVLLGALLNWPTIPANGRYYRNYPSGWTVYSGSPTAP